MSIDLAAMVAFLRENPEASWNPLYDAIEELASTTRQEPFTNSIGMELVWIPPGRFMMGASATDKEAYDFEKPQHEVVLTRGFHLGKYPVTRGQYGEFVRATGHKSAGKWEEPGFVQTDGHPVVNVSWEDAMSFCAWLSEGESFSYRLPTEAEWEYSCRAGTLTPRYKGRKSLDKIAWYHTNSGGSTHAVGEKESNGWGLHDMLGNVWEWCFDYWSDKYSMDKCIDIVCLEEGTIRVIRVIRGGGWSLGARYCRSAFRGRVDPSDAGASIGFRLARSSH